MTSILVVEDDPGIALGLEDDLKLEGYDVEVARDGETALVRARERRFDLIVLDLMLPHKDGYQVCRELRHAGMDAPIIMLTARTQEAEKVLGLEMGADDYVTKPFSPIELRARIKAVLRRTSRDAPAVHRFGDVEVDFLRHEVRRAGRHVDLTPTEFKLLTAFVRHPGRVLTREQLLDEAWGHGVFVTERVVDNQMTNLRKKIEPEPSRPRHLCNVRGVGYRFEE